jgi:hypothetical protein
MRIDFEKIAEEAFVDELNKIAMAPPLGAIGHAASAEGSHVFEEASVKAREAAIRAKKMAPRPATPSAPKA